MSGLNDCVSKGLKDSAPPAASATSYQLLRQNIGRAPIMPAPPGDLRVSNLQVKFLSSNIIARLHEVAGVRVERIDVRVERRGARGSRT